MWVHWWHISVFTIPGEVLEVLENPPWGTVTVNAYLHQAPIKLQKQKGGRAFYPGCSRRWLPSRKSSANVGWNEGHAKDERPPRKAQAARPPSPSPVKECVQLGPELFCRFAETPLFHTHSETSWVLEMNESGKGPVSLGWTVRHQPLVRFLHLVRNTWTMPSFWFSSWCPWAPR